ncbi:MAG TPA: ribosome maturation factor RimM [Pyrinomonadaceae bacterium]|nr:ribosome maturation factor RimM [Pyrinomonadaceae bacterium]
MNDLIAIARIARPRGVRGELVAEVLTDFPERFDALESATAVLPNDGRRELKIQNTWFQNDRVVLKFEGIDSIEAGEELRDAEICVPESETVELEDGEFFDWQLEGCTVVTVDGEPLGKVKELMRTGGTEVLVIDGEKEYLVPFAESICTEVDIENKRIVIDPPEGLLDF